jgi:transketolase
MEGVASEAASLAGHLQLGKLIYFYDDNRISIDGSTEITFTEDRAARFESYQWQVLRVKDGNDIAAVGQAIQKAKTDPRPTLIICRTHIGYGLPTKQDTAGAHGSPPGDKELDGAKEKLGWPIEPRFLIPEEVREIFGSAAQAGEVKEKNWQQLMKEYEKDYPDLAAELKRRLAGNLPGKWEVPQFEADGKGMATRAASGKVLNHLAGQIPEILGGSADLKPSNKTWLDGELDFQPGQYQGRNFYFGVREHGMGAVVNGMAIHGGLIPYGGTFLVFSDYMRPAVRISALSHIPSIWVYTHDSIGVGEDGPTHQPVEHLASLRAIPQLTVLRPADANETAQAWAYAVAHRAGPTALVLSRQSLPVIDREQYEEAEGLHRGAYVLGDLGDNEPELILMASGSEVEIIIKAGEALAVEGISTRLVSFPSWEIFRQQDEEYRQSVLPARITKRLAVEAGVSQGWLEWVGEDGRIIGVDQYGASAPAKVIYEKYGLTPSHVIEQAKELLRSE